jgi:acetyltransferase-like isoleucine patch superfamily enzyme
MSLRARPFKRFFLSYSRALVFTRLKLWRCAQVGEDVTVLGRVWVHGDASIIIRRGVTLDGRRAPIELHASHGGTLTIGPDCLIEGGTSIESEGAVTLGARVRIGAFVKIIDSHFHPVVGDRSARPKPSQVVIEDDVRVEDHVIILPGAHLGAGAIAEARSVLNRRVPPLHRAHGNPARHQPIAAPAHGDAPR